MNGAQVAFRSNRTSPTGWCGACKGRRTYLLPPPITNAPRKPVSPSRLLRGIMVPGGEDTSMSEAIAIDW